MSYRKFHLTNGNGQTVKLSELTSQIYLNNPAGLGYSNNVSTIQYGEKLNLLTTEQGFGSLGGEIIFYEGSRADKYKNYNDFVTFLSFKPLTLYYTIPTSTAKTYTMPVEVSNIDKTEIKQDGMMRCTFNMIALSRWQGDKVTVTGSTNTYSITNGGHMPVGFEITITGSSMENPYFTLTNDGGLYGEGKFTGTFDSVYVDSKDGEQNVELEQGGSVLPNPLSYQDLSISNGSIYVTFVKLARGTTTLDIGMDSGSLTSVTVEFIPLYRSV